MLFGYSPKVGVHIVDQIMDHIKQHLEDGFNSASENNVEERAIQVDASKRNELMITNIEPESGGKLFRVNTRRRC